VVTLAGERFASRRGVALLRAVELHELIAATPEDYVAIAQALSADLPRLAALRDGLRQRMRESPLADGKRYTSELEAVYGRAGSFIRVDLRSITQPFALFHPAR
jgi:protein O-GlcNAc transferase